MGFNKLFLAVVVVLLVIGCKKKGAEEKAPEKKKGAVVHGDTMKQKHGHGRKHGHGHKHGHHHKRHGSTADYIKRLESPKRVAWQKPDAVIKALELKGTELITDLGAGGGFFAFRFAKALPKGRVIALDINKKMVAHMEERLVKSGVTNITIKKVDVQKPTLDPLTDIVFINNVLHHVEEPVVWLKHIGSQMKKGAVLVILEFKMGKLPVGPPESMRIPRAKLVSLLKEAGFPHMTEKKGGLEIQEFLLFKKP